MRNLVKKMWLDVVWGCCSWCSVFDDKALLVTQDMDKACWTTLSVNDLLKITDDEEK